MENKKVESITVDGTTYEIEKMGEGIKRLVKTYENTLEKARKAEEELTVYSAAVQHLGPMIVNAVREEAAKALQKAQQAANQGANDAPPADPAA